MQNKKEQRISNNESQPFLSDVAELRKRARQHIEEGAVTPSYTGNRENVIRVLNEALATEIVCVLRYKNHYFTAEGLQAKAVADEFLEHAQEEEQHVDMLARRIRQLGGNPEMNPAILAGRSHSEYSESDDLIELLKEDLIAERIAIESYREIVTYLNHEGDVTSRRILEEILAKEEEHADDLQSLLRQVNSQGLFKKHQAA